MTCARVIQLLSFCPTSACRIPKKSRLPVRGGRTCSRASVEEFNLMSESHENCATSGFFGLTMVNLRSCTPRTVTVQHMLIGHTHSKRFFYNSEESVSLNIFECRYF